MATNLHACGTKKGSGTLRPRKGRACWLKYALIKVVMKCVRVYVVHMRVCEFCVVCLCLTEYVQSYACTRAVLVRVRNVCAGERVGVCESLCVCALVFA